MAAKIFEMASSIDLSESRTTFRAVSQSGYAKTLIGSPLFYYASVTVNPMYKADFIEIQKELAAIGYGTESVLVYIPYGLTWADGTAWQENVVTQSVVSGGTSVTLNGLVPNGTIKAMDWLKFANSSKVYQVIADTTADNAGSATVTLNTGLVTPITSSQDVTFGSNVRFKFLLTEKPMPTSIPGFQGNPQYSFNGAFNFREVL